MGGVGAPTDAEDFFNGAGACEGVETGLDNVDLWIGGLAEAIMPFGGMLGSTFNFVSRPSWRTCRTATGSTTWRAPQA